MPFSYLTLSQVRFRQGGKCARCGEPLNHPTGFARHILPESFGASDVPKNCVLTCERCHRRIKEDRDFQGRIRVPLSYFPYARIG